MEFFLESLIFSRALESFSLHLLFPIYPEFEIQGGLSEVTSLGLLERQL